MRLIQDTAGNAFFEITSSGPEDTNLFNNFQGVMPGNSLTQTVRGSADGGNRGRFNIYLYARQCTEKGMISTPDFLELTIDVQQNGSSIGSVDVGSGTGMDGVLLGRFNPGDAVELTVTLGVDINMGNEFQDAAQYIDWAF